MNPNGRSRTISQCQCGKYDPPRIHLASEGSLFDYCPGSDFPEQAITAAEENMASIRRAREAARAAWTL